MFLFAAVPPLRRPGARLALDALDRRGRAAIMPAGNLLDIYFALYKSWSFVMSRLGACVTAVASQRQTKLSTAFGLAST